MIEDKKNDKIGNSIFIFFIIACIYVIIMIITTICTHLFIPVEIKDYIDNLSGLIIAAVGLIIYVYKLFKIWK